MDLEGADNVLDGTVFGRNIQRHGHQEFIRFLNAVEGQVPAGKVVHVIVDNYAAHKPEFDSCRQRGAILPGIPGA